MRGRRSVTSNDEGMDINISTTAKSDDESYWLLKHIGLPLREKPNKTEESIEVN